MKNHNNNHPKKKLDLDDYHRDRLGSWNENADLWVQYIDHRDFDRVKPFKGIFERFQRSVRPGPVPRIIDLGCGEGLFLRQARHYFDKVQLVGIDFCDGMLRHARERSAGQSIEYIQGDFETGDLTYIGSAHFVTANFSLMEAVDLNIAFKNIAGLLRPGGLAAIVVLDPTTDSIRYPLDDGRKRDYEYVMVGSERALVKHFIAGRHVSVKPYYRFTRPITDYDEAAESLGLERASSSHYQKDGVGDSPTNMMPRYETLYYKKG